MKRDRVQFLWQNPAAPGNFRAGICLHSHTMHSKECLSFLPRVFGHLPGMGIVLRRHAGLDFSRAYWTPPLPARAAMKLEREQIEGLGLNAIVSLTDHDNIEAGLEAQAGGTRAQAPVSVEWTAPFASSI